MLQYQPLPEVPAGLAAGGGEVLEHGPDYREEVREDLEI